MTIVKRKYRGTPEYFNVFAELIQAARYRGLTTYQDIALIIGLPLKGSYMGVEAGHILGEISEDELASGRPMLSAVAVGVQGTPGSGFYTLARELGRLADQDETAFWKLELEAVYQTWKRRLPET